jgi:hypothetical protein
MRKYGLTIQSYVIEQRKQGKPWKDLQQEVGDKFGTKPPTIRAMQKWVQRGLDHAQIDKMLMEEAKKKLPQATAFTQAYFSEVMLPNIWRSQALGADLEQTMWMLLLSAMETAIGSDKFERFINEYMNRRIEVKEQVKASSPFSSKLESLKQEKSKEEVKTNERIRSAEV